jgi:hypothetical protein
MANNNIYSAGLNNAGSYQVSGIPYMTGSLTVPASGSTLKIEFPYVTRWIAIANNSNAHIRFGFSDEGVIGSNHYITHEENHPTQNGPYEVKVTELFLSSDTSQSKSGVYVFAGLTNIPVSRVNNISPSGSNWSGSIGVG